MLSFHRLIHVVFFFLFTSMRLKMCGNTCADPERGAAEADAP